MFNYFINSYDILLREYIFYSFWFCIIFTGVSNPMMNLPQQNVQQNMTASNCELNKIALTQLKLE